MKAGAKYKQRAMIAANRIGKTFTGGIELAYHATGDYPEWWEGRRFDEPIEAWICGKTAEATKDILQKKLLGDITDPGTGFIPKDKIVKITNRPGVQEAVMTIRVRHVTGGVSEITLKAYDQKRDAFQGTSKHVIWLDEEPRDQGIYTECLTRTMKTGSFPGGIIYCTFTPLFGMSDVVESFLPGGRLPKDGVVEGQNKYVCQLDWEDAPHLDDDEKAELLATYLPYERDARSKGIPSFGSGRIYPILEEDVLVEPFKIPEHWERAYGFDVGWNRSAAVWAAVDPDSRQVFLYSEYYRGQAEPPIHAEAIKSRGAKIPGVIDPAANAANNVDGGRLLHMYMDLGLDLIPADNSVEAGLMKVWGMLSSGQLKVFNTLENWTHEFRKYRRDEKGQIVKRDDHLMDAMRYLIMSGLELARSPLDIEDEDQGPIYNPVDDGASETTGY